MSKTDYTHHRLTNDNELLSYLNKMGGAEFWIYLERLHTKIYNMKPGESFDVDDVVIEENRDLFIKILCFFIMDYPSRYLFNNTYTTFYRLKPTEKFPAETLEQQLARIVRKKY